MWYRCILIILALLFSIFVRWYNEPTYVQENTCTITDLVDNPKAIEKATLRMGPSYNYMIDPDGTLRVNTGNGKWLKLKY